MKGYLTDSDVAAYRRDGYVLVEGLFNQKEVKAMVDAVEGEGRASQAWGTLDSAGRAARLALWGDIGDDVWGAATTDPRIVNNIRILQGEEIAFFHGKVMLKEAHTGGAFEWHQDYGYWYDQGFLFPRMMSAFVAIDRATRENGCLQVLRGTHRLGRLSHGQVGAQTGADPARMEFVERYFDRVFVEMTPGSVLFFDCNTLHSSAPNESPNHRRSFIMCYNALGNPQVTEKQWFEQRPCPVGPADAVMRFAAAEPAAV